MQKKIQSNQIAIVIFAIVLILRHVFFCVCHAPEHSDHYFYEYSEREYWISLEVT